MINNLAGGPSPTNVGPFEQQPNALPKGGRRGNRHGDAIAAVTLVLLDGSPDLIDNSTGEAVGEQLRAEYLNLKKVPPSDRSLRDQGEGILRVLRKYRGL